jgi:excisionase family DNA binding protein
MNHSMKDEPLMDPVSEEEPRLLPPRRFFSELGVGRDAGYQLVHEGRIRHLSVGRRILIPRTELDEFPARELKRQDEATA